MRDQALSQASHRVTELASAFLWDTTRMPHITGTWLSHPAELQMFRRLSKQLVDSVKSTNQDIRSQTMPQTAAYKANGLHEQEQGETPPLLAVLRAVLRHKSSLHALSLRLMGLRVIPKYIL